jgi:hypothetical protein
MAETRTTTDAPPPPESTQTIALDAAEADTHDSSNIDADDATLAGATSALDAADAEADAAEEAVDAASGLDAAEREADHTEPADQNQLAQLAELYSRTGSLSNREVVEQGVGLPRTQEMVELYTRLAEVDFRRAPVEIVEDADTIAYLDHMGATARTDDLGVQLGPASFHSEELLVRTLGHEAVHVRQYQEGRINSNTEPLEGEARGVEAWHLEIFERNRPR